MVCIVADFHYFSFEGEYGSQVIEFQLNGTLDSTDQHCLELEHAERMLTFIQFTPKKGVTLLQEK